MPAERRVQMELESLKGTISAESTHGQCHAKILQAAKEDIVQALAAASS